MSFQQIPRDYEVQEGDLLLIQHCIQAPNIPFNEVLASFQTTLTNFEQRINSELPGCVTVEVVDKDMYRSSGVVVEGDECEFIHETEVRVTDYRPGECPTDSNVMTAGLIGLNITTALLALALLIGVAVVFHQANKFVRTPAGEDVSKALLIGAAAFALMQVRKLRSDLDDEDD